MKKFSGLLILLIAAGAVALVSCGGSVAGSSTARSSTASTNGACGSSDGAAFSTLPTVGLCRTGTATTVSGTGPWIWSCSSDNGGSTVGCAAIKANASAHCPYPTALPDGCLGAPAGTTQLPHLLDVQQVTALNILPGSGYTDGTYNWTASGSGGSAASGTVAVLGGALGGSTGLLYTIANQGTHYTSRPAIAVPPAAGAGIGGSITPTVYQATPHNASTPWNMPGVDYYVGIPPSVTSLKDPTINGNLPPGATLSGNTVTVTGCNVTLDSLDFTLHSTVLVINVTGANCTTTVQNSKQHAISTTVTYKSIALLQSLGSGGVFLYQNNEYDGLAPYGKTGGSGLLVDTPICCIGSSGSNVTLMYNYFHNFDSKIIQLSGTLPSSSFMERYNLFANFGSCGTNGKGPCQHGEAEYTYSINPGTLSFTSQFNTYILPSYVGTPDPTAPQAVQADNMTLDGVLDDHNAILAQGPQNTCSYNNQIAYVAAAAVFDGAQNDPNAALLTNATFAYNYIDNSGTYFPWYHAATGGAKITNTTWTNNVDTGTGNSCN